MSTIADNLQVINEKIAHASEHSGRTVGDVALVVVTKTVPLERIEAAVDAGARHLGENRVQEADAKFGEEREGAPIRGKITLHMIGGLQRNKARRAAELFDWVQSVDRWELMAALDKAAGEAGRAPLPVLLEVNTTGEAAKSGVEPEALGALADGLDGCSNLRGMGLMTVARLGADEAELRRTFGGLRALLEGLRGTHAHAGEWKHLSMGMSDDYEVAVQEGSTMVRLGRAVFGERTR
jgi:pyridoxal phosphate enzyme (YggS family)